MSVFDPKNNAAHAQPDRAGSVTARGAVRAIQLGALLMAGLLLASCADVDPWQRGRLAKPHMALDHNPIKRAANTHVNSSREAMPSGGAGEGGGCGCY